MSALGPRSQARRSEARFALVSVVLHAVLIYAVSREAWIAAAPDERRSPSVIWLDALPPASAPPEAAREDADPRPVVAPEPAPSTRSESPRRAEADVRAEPASRTEPPVEPAPAPESPAPPEVDLGSDEQNRIEPPSIDFEAERQRAVALVIEQQARERGYRTFSLDDLVDEPPPDAEPGAEQDVFAGPSSGPAAMRPGRARTRLGRAISEICNDLTGGIGVLGLFSLCAEEGERADFFGHLRPAYMEKLPVCTEQELTEAQLAAAQITDLSEIETRVIKCRLVDRDEVLVVPE